jgi:hypothetical protein
LQTANGEVVEASVAVLKSIRLGQFVVENVECVVLPKSAKDAMGLLGGTFLRHFVYRMDLGVGILHMSQMSGRGTLPAVDPRAIASTEPAVGGTTRPSIFNDEPTSRPVADEGKRLFDGTSLAGWQMDPKRWSVSDGTIKGNFDGGREGRYAYAPGKYGDFVLDVEFKIASGNSGVVFRAEPQLETENGYQVDIYPNAIGKLAYNGQVLFRPEGELQKQVYRAGEWNRYTVEAKGERIRVLLNGTVMAELEHGGGPREGRVGLEVYGKTEVYFREVRIRELR